MQNSSTDFDNDQIPISTPPEKVLEGFNNELRHFISSIDGCVHFLSLNPGEEQSQYLLDIISRNLDRMKSQRESVRIYLEKRIEQD